MIQLYRYLKTGLLSLTAYFLPVLVFAQNSAPNNFKELIDIFTSIISATIPVIIALALLYFFWGLARFILNTGGGKEKEEAKNTMVWGIIGLFVMLSIWGIVRVLQGTLIF
jgi:succinate dehydrogenase/fumarate reductase cytochrome b subunit